MPEGDVVWLTARRLHAALAGRSLTRSDFRVPRHAGADLRGRRVHEVVSRGKHLLIRVDGDVTIHTHLMMDGSWRIAPAGSGASASRDPNLRLVLANDQWQALGRSLGVVDILRTGQEETVLGRLGPDLLGPGWDPDEAERRLRARPERPIGEALLDQTALAGIGNVYKAEVLFLRGVHPWQAVGDVDDLPGLIALAQRLLDANKERHGHVTTGDRRPGHEHWVYGRAGRPCRRCGTRIERAAQGPHASPGARLAGAGVGAGAGAGAGSERITFWCPHCQPRHEPRRS